MADLRHRGDRLRLRHLRAADAAADHQAGDRGAQRAARRAAGGRRHAAAAGDGALGAGRRRIRQLGAHAVLRAGDGRRRVRPARRLPHRPARAAPRADLQHPALRAARPSPPASPPRCEQLLVLRCVVFVGVCVEFVAAVAWLAELFDDPQQREKVLGYTQAFSSLRRHAGGRRQRRRGQHAPPACRPSTAATRRGATR